MTIVLLVVIYVAFVGLGIPDSLFGAAWPAMYADLGLPVSLGSVVTMIISCGTIVSSLSSAAVINRFGTGRVTAASTVLTAAALLGFSLAPSLLWLCLLAVPLGLGAGAIDTALNNYVALHYRATHMNFLHCAYGVGVTVSPFIMSFALSAGTWREGYLGATICQAAIALLTIAILPLWGKVARADEERGEKDAEPRTESPLALVRRRDVRLACLVFLASVAIEGICNTWGTSYLVNARGMGAGEAAGTVTVYYVGVTLGRFLSGVLANRLSSKQLVGLGQLVTFAAVLVLLAPLPVGAASVGLFLVGFGNSPLYPNMLHLTPRLFGRELSQSVIGVQMAASYVGSLALAPLFGVVGQSLGFWLFPVALLALSLVVLGAFVALMTLKGWSPRAAAARLVRSQG
ncbi:MFS transporter [Thermophilibacter mediterraneus]|uniref:MFS transporter n=1 Tax=Thermophilibacter mediterraneus TaxID=1871031 RepID=UPI000930CDC2|nr:MFS transporter [Thermophilibacter mediterraneus]